MTEQPIEWDERGATSTRGKQASSPLSHPTTPVTGLDGSEQLEWFEPAALALAPTDATSRAVHHALDQGASGRSASDRVESKGARAVVVVTSARSHLADDLVALGHDVVAYRATGSAPRGHRPARLGLSSCLELEAREEALVLADLVRLGDAVDDARNLFVDAYALLRPGGLLLLTLDAPDVAAPGGRRSSRAPVRSTRDAISTLLFGAGFTRPVFRRLDNEQLLVEAERGAAAPPSERRQTLSVVMPVYNEHATFSEVMDGLVAKKIDGLDIEIVVVESNSTDGTREQVLSYADQPGVRIVLEERASGKGHAVRAGLAEATGDFVLIQDADLEYDLDDYEVLLEPLRRLEASFVLGTRIRTDGARYGVRHFEKQVLIGQLMNLGNVLFLALFNLVYGVRLHDPFTMYKVIRRDCLHRMRLECDRFDFDWELTAKLLRAGYSPTEIPIRYQSRSFDEGKKISILGDPWSWIVACFRYRFAPFEQ